VEADISTLLETGHFYFALTMCKREANDLGTLEGTRNERVLAVAFSAHLRSGAKRAYFQTVFFLEVVALGNSLVMASGQMRRKRIFSCVLLGVSYCRLHKGGKD
jgi:hypothetical protein